MTEFNERVVRIQMKDQIDIMKRKKISPSEQYSSGEGEGDSLDPPTIKKPGGNNPIALGLGSVIQGSFAESAFGGVHVPCIGWLRVLAAVPRCLTH